MKIGFLILFLSFICGCSSCTTSTVKKDVVFNLASTFSGYAECGGYDEMKDFFEDLVDDLDCSQVDFESKYIKFLPDGAWSAKATCCVAVLSKLPQDEGVIVTDKSWNCAKTADYETALHQCQKLE